MRLEALRIAGKLEPGPPDRVRLYSSTMLGRYRYALLPAEQ
jgi:hypothetical protein